MSEYETLWVRVIAQAITDATCVADDTEKLHDRNVARGWFRYRPKDYYLICSLAGLDPDWVYELFAGIIRKNQRILANNGRPRKTIAADSEILDALFQLRADDCFTQAVDNILSDAGISFPDDESLKEWVYS